MDSINKGLYIGVDGCRGGWIAAVLDQGSLYLERFASIQDLVDCYADFDTFLIDMVIGLRSSASQLRPDDLAKKELGTRASTIFPVPCRQAVYAETEEEQKKENLRILGKSLSKQTANILPKMREVDVFLKGHPEYKNRILESHPELDFARLSGAVVQSKKKDPGGLAERSRILERFLPGGQAVNYKETAKSLKCNPDDILDAVCLAVTAALNAQGLCETIPAAPEQDDEGLYMKLTVPKKGEAL